MIYPRALLAIGFVLSFAATDTQAAVEIGTARAVKKDVTGTVEAQERAIKEGVQSRGISSDI